MPNVKTNFKTGMKVIISGNSNGHKYKTGQILTLKVRKDSESWFVREGQDYVMDKDIKLAMKTKAEIEERLGLLENESKTLKTVLRWMDKIGVEEFDESEFKVWTILQEAKEDKEGKKRDDIDIAKAIVKELSGDSK